MTTGAQLLSALQSVRRFHAEVSLLLKTADTYLLSEDVGFKRLTGSVALSYGTASVDRPSQWMPHMAFRFYRVPAVEGEPARADDSIAAHRFAMVSAVLCPRSIGDYKLPFTEPLVTAGWVRLRDRVPDKFSDYWWAEMAKWFTSPRDGTIAVWQDENAQGRSVEQHFLAVPLLEVPDGSTLNSRILEPLVSSVRGSS